MLLKMDYIVNARARDMCLYALTFAICDNMCDLADRTDHSNPCIC